MYSPFYNNIASIYRIFNNECTQNKYIWKLTKLTGNNYVNRLTYRNKSTQAFRHKWSAYWEYQSAHFTKEMDSTGLSTWLVNWISLERVLAIWEFTSPAQQSKKTVQNSFPVPHIHAPFCIFSSIIYDRYSKTRSQREKMKVFKRSNRKGVQMFKEHVIKQSGIRFLTKEAKWVSKRHFKEMTIVLY